jgi:alkylation response protein AidB-like acyl-CoA dehydrogenase
MTHRMRLLWSKRGKWWKLRSIRLRKRRRSQKQRNKKDKTHVGDEGDMEATRITREGRAITNILTEQLAPLVRSIDCEGVYPNDFLQSLFASGAYALGSDRTLQGNGNTEALELIERVSEVCGSTGFSIWCHTAAIHYIRCGQSEFLREEVLPGLVSGALMGGTGLSNPMKFYAGLEPLRLKADPVGEGDGYCVHGVLPFISNLGRDHWFGLIAETPAGRRVMAVVPCSAEGISMEVRENFLGLNGTATYTCRFDNVQVQPEWVVADDADAFVRIIRPGFVLSQIGLSLGVTRAAIDCMKRQVNKQAGANRFLPVQPEDVERRWLALRERAYRLAEQGDSVGSGVGDGAGTDESAEAYWQEVLRTRLDSAYLALEAVQADFLHCGGAGYVLHSDPSRRMREAYFIAVLTPSIKHLEKLLQVGA